MQFLDSLQYVGAEAAQVKTCLRCHCHLIDLHRTTLHGYCEIAVTAFLRYKLEFVFLPLLANLAKRLAGYKLTVGITQSYNKLAFSLSI